MLDYNNFNSSISPAISNYGLLEYFLLPAVAVGGAMETSSSGTVRGIGAGIRTVGAPLAENIGKEIVTKGLTKNALSTGFKNTFNFKGAAGAGFGMGAAGEVLNAIAGPKQEYSGYKGDVTKGLDAAYDGILTAVSFVPGVGLIVGGAMGLAKGVGSMLNKWGGGTDAMTDVDATLGSNFFSWNVGALNGFTGKKSHTMDNQDFMNLNKLDLMWSGYSGTLDTDLYALTKAGKKYGGFSSGARKRANRIIDAANMNREHLLGMQSDTFTGDIRGNLMADINSAAYNQELYGGIKPILTGKQGLKFSDLQKTIKNLPKRKKGGLITLWKPELDFLTEEIQKFKQGGQVNVIPEGSLHARLHHMEGADGLTKKGIPVVDNNGNQLAEIELNEIIFRKEVTDKLEELAKDGSAEAAIEAGKLLVEEIFENTDDRTGLIEQITGEANLQGAEVFKKGGIVKADLGITLLKEYNSLASNLLKALAFTQALGKGMEGIMDASKGSLLARQKREELLNDAFTNKMEYSNELADLKNWMSTVIKTKEDELNLDRKELYAQTHAEPVLSALKGDRILLQDILGLLMSLSPEKLLELLNILKQLNND